MERATSQYPKIDLGLVNASSNRQLMILPREIKPEPAFEQTRGNAIVRLSGNIIDYELSGLPYRDHPFYGYQPAWGEFREFVLAGCLFNGIHLVCNLADRIHVDRMNHFIEDGAKADIEYNFSIPQQGFPFEPEYMSLRVITYPEGIVREYHGDGGKVFVSLLDTFNIVRYYHAVNEIASDGAEIIIDEFIGPAGFTTTSEFRAILEEAGFEIVEEARYLQDEEVPEQIRDKNCQTRYGAIARIVCRRPQDDDDVDDYSTIPDGGIGVFA